ncbi:MAG: hypothetical protein KDA65_18735 [Planctomycetaceae bacterium]|nr:hypothetical protein [Planctomycetaceae bacterium]
MRLSKLYLLILGLTVCWTQTGCYYLRLERDKKIACLRRSPVSIRKMKTSPALFPQYKEPAGYSQTYKDYLYENDPYHQTWEGGPIAVGMNQAMRVEGDVQSEDPNSQLTQEEPVPKPLDLLGPELN